MRPSDSDQRGRAEALEEPRRCPTSRPRDSSRGRVREHRPNMVPIAATPTEKNSAQPVSCGTVRASGYSRNPRASHRNPNGIDRAPADLVGERAERRDQAQREQLVGEIERGRPCGPAACAGSPRLTLSRYGCK